MTNVIRDYFEVRAPTWDSMMPATLDEALRQLLIPFAHELGTARSILEIGSGTGALIPHLRQCAPVARLVSIDLAYAMLKNARHRAPGVGLVQTDVHHLPFSSSDSLFDLVVCHNSFPHFADKTLALHEIRRVLCPGGQLFILHNNSREKVNAIHIRAGAPIADDLLPSGEEMHQLLLQAGYQQASVDDTPEHYIARGQRQS
jgi:demethylmenaquinone methyltransferase/2-methoxy-6-polyprenyl-1,4-benzoquinol methylase